MFKKIKLISLASILKVTEKLLLIYLGLRQESSYIGKQKIVFYKTKLFKPLPAPTIVLIHGFGADKNHWLPVSRLLKNEFNLIILDVPGFGESPLNSFAKYTLDEQVSVIMEFLLRIVPSDQYIIGGNSLGGFFSAVIAAKAPQKVIGLWLLAPAGVTTEQHAEGVELILKGKNPLLVKNSLDFAQLSQLCFYNPPAKGWFYEVLEQKAMRRFSINKQLFTQMFGLINGISENPLKLEELARGIECETLIVWGDSDRIVTPDGMQVLIKKIKSNESKLMFQVGHLPMLEAPEKCAKDLIEFYNRKIFPKN